MLTVPHGLEAIAQAQGKAGELARYHLAELATALDAADPARNLPDVRDTERVILDVGCGIGQTLVALDLRDRTLIGVDVDADAIALGRQLAEQVQLHVASAESLPVPSATVDLAISRVALPYTDLRQAVAELARVVKPGGRVWLTLHPVAFGVTALREDWRRRHWRGILYRAYVLLNGALLHVTGRVVRYPLNRQRLESVQTDRAIRRALRRHGFADATIAHGTHFLVTAVRH